MEHAIRMAALEGLGVASEAIYRHDALATVEHLVVVIDGVCQGNERATRHALEWLARFEQRIAVAEAKKAKAETEAAAKKQGSKDGHSVGTD